VAGTFDVFMIIQNACVHSLLTIQDLSVLQCEYI